jgi:hypothetical protein
MPSARSNKETKRRLTGDSIGFLASHLSPLIRPVQVARGLNRSAVFIHGLIHEGRLEVLGVPGRQRQRYQVTKRSVLLHLAESADFQPSEFNTWLETFLPIHSTDQLSLFIADAEQARRGA